MLVGAAEDECSMFPVSGAEQLKHSGPIGRRPVIRYLKLIKSVRLSVEALGFKGSFVAFALF